MDAWERKQVLGQWGVREENARERAERKVLERELDGAPFAGKRAKLRPHFFHPSPESYVASLGGPLPYMIRLREIEAATVAHEEALERVWRETALECRGESTSFEARWRRLAERWDFGEVNDLIDRHNRYYPAEARLPMDPVRGDFVLVNGEPYRKNPLDVRWVLERFPAALAAVAA